MVEDVNTQKAPGKKKRARIMRNGGGVTTAQDLARMELEDKYKDKLEMEALMASLGRSTGGVGMSDLIKSTVAQQAKKAEEEKKQEAKKEKESPKIETSYSKEREEAFVEIRQTLGMLKEILYEYKETGDRSKIAYLTNIDERIKRNISKIGSLALSDFDKDIISDIRKTYDAYNTNNTGDSLRAFERAVKNGESKEIVKKIKALSINIANGSQEAKKELEEFLNNKSDREKSAYISEIVGDYKKKRTDKKFKAMNIFLNACGREVERFSYVETSYDQRKAARFAFDGSFSIPAERSSDDRDFDKNEFSPYSDVYKKFLGDRKAKRGRVTEKNKPETYGLSLAENEAWKTLVQAGVDISEEKVKEAFSMLDMPKTLVKKLNCTDLAKVLYDAHILKNNPKYDITKFPENGVNISFKEIDNNSETYVRDSFLKKCFENQNIFASVEADLLSKGVSEKYIALLKKSVLNKDNPTANPDPVDENGNKISGPIPFITIHHKTPIQDAAKLGDFSKINDFSNLLIVVDMPGEANHELRHITDEPLCINKNQISEDDAELLPAWQGADEIIAERMVDTADRRSDSKSLVYSSGFDNSSNIIASVMSDNIQTNNKNNDNNIVTSVSKERD